MAVYDRTGKFDGGRIHSGSLEVFLALILPVRESIMSLISLSLTRRHCVRFATGVKRANTSQQRLDTRPAQPCVTLPPSIRLDRALVLRIEPPAASRPAASVSDISGPAFPSGPARSALAWSAHRGPPLPPPPSSLVPHLARDSSPRAGPSRRARLCPRCTAGRPIPVAPFHGGPGPRVPDRRGRGTQERRGNGTAHCAIET